MLKIIDKNNIKKGEIYYTPVKVINANGNTKVNVMGLELYCLPNDLYSLPPSEPPTLVGPAPKHDPCRKFRKGDKVRVVEKNGRKPPLAQILTDIYEQIFTVATNEDSDNDVLIETSKGDRFVQFSYLELVTPIEEQEPYFVGESENSYDLFRRTSNGNQLRASFWWKHKPTPDMIELSTANAKAAAEAECARLNAKHREEQ